MARRTRLSRRIQGGEPDVIEVALAAFDDDVPVMPDAHIFVESAPNWTSIADDLPQYEKGRGSNEFRR